MSSRGHEHTAALAPEEHNELANGFGMNVCIQPNTSAYTGKVAHQGAQGELTIMSSMVGIIYGLRRTLLLLSVGRRRWILRIHIGSRVA